VTHPALDETRAILGELISFPTVSSADNLALISSAAERLSDCGARISFTRSEDGARANLFATIGPERDGGIVLSGHTDVVPAEEPDWLSDPFAMTDRDGALYGRGACDMKGFVAATLAMAPRFAERPLARPVHFAFTYDEEIGCLGARQLIESLRANGPRPSVAIIGEPTEMRIIEGHKGCHEYTTAFFGREGHSAYPDSGVSAVEYAVRFAGRLLGLRTALNDRTPADSRFDPPGTTLHIGRIAGGAAHNVIAGHCAVDWEMRPISGDDAAFVRDEVRRICESELLPAMRAIHTDARIETTTLGEVAGLTPSARSEARTLVEALTGARDSDVVCFGTEAGLFQALGLSAVVCGPGSIAQAHKPNEFVALSQLDACLAMLDGLRQRLAEA